MPAPPLDYGIAAQVVLQSDTGFFRDAVVNTFHFRHIGNSSATQAEKDWVAATLISFYNDVHGAGSNQLRWYLSSTLDQGDNKAMVKVYDMGHPHPIPPDIYPFTLAPAAGSDNGLPTEVALCLSYSSSSLPTKRGRGRIYLGPLHSNVVNLEAPNVHVNPSAILAIQRAARYLIDANTGSTPSCAWGIYSRVDNQIRAVTNAYVDNEFDTQRRRGHKATVRSLA
jgi:hypothetical protein